MSTESDLRRYRDQASRLRKQISKESATVASSRKEAADKQGAAAKASSESVRRSRLREADAAEKSANAAEKKRADLEKKLAETEKKLADTQARSEKESRKAQQDALDELHRRSESAAGQFRPSSLFSRPDIFESPSTPLAFGTESLNEAKSETRADIFLSHASEDKDEIARPLKMALEAQGLTVWFDEISIKVGQSIRQEIEKGLTQARFGVVLLSPHFFAKQWTQAELDALFDKKMTTGRDLILPIWHRVTKDEVQAHSPLLSGIKALNTSFMTTDEIAEGIAEVARAADT
jgi:hypothetical protein